MSQQILDIMNAANAEVRARMEILMPVLHARRDGDAHIVPGFIQGLTTYPAVNLPSSLRTALAIHVPRRDLEIKREYWAWALGKAIPRYFSSYTRGSTVGPHHVSEYLNDFYVEQSKLRVSGARAPEIYTSFDIYTIFYHGNDLGRRKDYPKKARERLLKLYDAATGGTKPKTVEEFLKPYANITGFPADGRVLPQVLTVIGITPTRYGIFYDERDKKIAAIFTRWMRKHGTKGMSWSRDINWNAMANEASEDPKLGLGRALHIVFREEIYRIYGADARAYADRISKQATPQRKLHQAVPMPADKISGRMIGIDQVIAEETSRGGGRGQTGTSMQGRYAKPRRPIGQRRGKPYDKTR